MAQPSGVRPERGMPRYFACALALYASDRTYGIEIQRAPDSGGNPDTGNAETIAEVTGRTQVYIDERAGDGSQVHYRIRHVRTGETASDWTPWVALTPTFFTSAIAPAPVIPSVTETPTDDGATGTLALAVTDPQNRLVSVKGKSRSGNGAEEENWQTLSLSGGSYTDTVDLALKHPSTIRYQLNHYDELGQSVTREKVVPFPLASKPVKPLITLTMDASGNVTAHIEGDADTANIRAKGSKTAYPNEAAVDAEDPIAGSSVDTGTLINLDTGDTAYVSVRAYDSTPTGSDLAKAKLTAISEELNDPPSAPDSVTLTATTSRLQYEGPEDSVEYRYLTHLSLSVAYEKDGLFQCFQVRIWNGSEDKEEADIIDFEGKGETSPYTIITKRSDRNLSSDTWHCEVRVKNNDDQVSASWASDDDTASYDYLDRIDIEGARQGRVGLGPDGEPDPERDPERVRQRRSRDLFSGDGAPGGHKGGAGSGDVPAVHAEDIEIGSEADYRRPLKDVLGVGSDGKPEITDPSGTRMLDLESRDIAGTATINGDTASDVKDGSGRARVGLEESGDVARDVPLAKAVANVDAIDTTSGKIDEAITTKDGKTLENTTNSQTKATTAQSNAEATASADATTKADAAQVAAEATAATDATTKADAAQTAAEQEITDRGLDSESDFTGTINGVAASEIAGRAESGAPTNDPVPTGISLDQARDGSGEITLTWTYEQGAIPADGLRLLFNIGDSSGLSAPTVAACDRLIPLDSSSGSVVVTGYPADKFFYFGIVAYRSDKTGISYGGVVSSAGAPDWQNVQVSDTIDFDEDVEVRGWRMARMLEGSRRGEWGTTPDGEPEPDRDPERVRQRRSRDLFSGNGAPGGHSGGAGSGDTPAVSAEDIEVGSEADTKRPLKAILDIDSAGDAVLVDPATATELKIPTAQDSSDRSQAGLDTDGKVQLDVPLIRAVAEVPGLDDTTGKLKLGQIEDGDLDNIPEGTTYKRTTVNEKAGAGRGYVGLAENGDVDRDVPLAKAVANVDAIDTTSGKIDEAITTKAGKTVENTEGSQGKADTAESNAATDATTKADAAETAAAADATTKADAAEAAANQETTDRGLAADGDFTGMVVDQRNLPMLLSGGYRMMRHQHNFAGDLITAAWVGGEMQYCTISVKAHDVKYAHGDVSYNAGATVTGLATETRYYVYADDSNFAGGTVTWGTTTSWNDIIALGRYYVGTIVTPEEGGGGTGGGDGGNDPPIE